MFVIVHIMQRRFLHWVWLWLSRKDITRRTIVKTFKIKTALKKMKGVFLLWSSNLHNQQFWKNLSGTKTRLFLSLNWYLIRPPMLGSIFPADRTYFSMTERKHASRLTLSYEPRKKKHPLFSYAVRVEQSRWVQNTIKCKIAHNEFYRFSCTFIGPKCWYFTTNCFSNTKYNHLSYQF